MFACCSHQHRVKYTFLWSNLIPTIPANEIDIVAREVKQYVCKVGSGYAFSAIFPAYIKKISSLG